MSTHPAYSGIVTDMVPLSQRNMAIGSGKGSQVITERMYFRVISELALNRFAWDNLPEGVTSRFIELTLLTQGLCVFYFDPRYDRFMALRATGSGPVNMYDNPTEFRVYGNGTHVPVTLNPRECVPIWCNMMRVPDMDIVQVFSGKLASIDRTIDINLMQQRRPFIASVPESKRLTIINALKSIADGDMAVLGNDTFDMTTEIKTFDTQINPQLVPNTQLSKQKIWNECLTLLGINNANQDKRERLVADEVQANNEHVEAARYSGLVARQEACDAINSMFGLSVECRYTVAPMAIEDDFTAVELRNNAGEGGGTDGDVHGNIA